MGDSTTVPGPTARGARPGGQAGLVALAALATFVARLPVLVAHHDTWLPFEVQSGTIATALIDGLTLDHARLPIIAHIRGSALFGYLLVPLYALLGPTSLAMKLLPLLWHAATAGLVVALLDRFATRRAAVAAALLLVFAPPMLAKVSVLGLASHLESSLFWLAALGLLLSAERVGRVGRGRCLALGAIVGLSGYFHLQALLGCLLVLGLLVVSVGRRVGLAGALALALGTALGAAPAGFYEGGNVRYLRQQVGGLAGVSDSSARLLLEAATSAADAAARSNPARLVDALGFGPGSDVVGLGYAALLAAAAAAALAGWTAGRPGRRSGAGGAPRLPVGALFFVAHPLVVLASFFTLGMRLAPSGASAGVEYRRLAGGALSLLVLAALGIGRPAGMRFRRAQTVLLIGLCALGAAGLAEAARKPATPLQRGECYEWFLPQLAHHAGGDPETLLETIARVDRGDRRFAVLRFAVDWPELAAADAATIAAERAAWRGSPGERDLFRAAALGRALIESPTRLAEVDVRMQLAALDGAGRAALWHGAGIAIPPIRPGLDAGQYRVRLAAVAGLCGRLQPADAERLAEGYGFARGFAIDPHAESLVAALADFASFGPSLGAALYRGAGWGYRQRWIDPPTERPPEGLTVLGAVPAGAREHFLDGLLARRLPAEASAAGPAPPSGSAPPAGGSR